MPTVKLCVYGMRDARDEERVEQALAAERGVFGAVANHETACAEVDCEDDELDILHLLEVVEAVGFRAALGG